MTTTRTIRRAMTTYYDVADTRAYWTGLGYTLEEETTDSSGMTRFVFTITVTR
jgi:hypothetical protein